jgi:hypothetical protein
MSLAVDQRSNADGFVKPGELVTIRGGADLSLQDRRIFNLLIENAWSEIAEDKEHRIAIAKLRGPRHKGGERVADSIKALMTTLVEVPTTLNGEPAIFTTLLLVDTTRTIDENSPSALLLYHFPKGMREIIRQSQHWGRIKAYVMFAFTSKYALTLYEVLCLRANLRVNEQRFSVEAFRDLLGVEKGKLPLYKSLKQRVLDPAIEEINALSDFNVEIEAVREGGMLRGKLTGFRLRWEKKSQEEWRAALDELLRPTVGRRARIKGTVETVAL